MANANIDRDAFDIRECQTRDGQPAPLHWVLFVRSPGGVEVELLQSDRKGVIVEAMMEARKLFCEQFASAWRQQLRPGRDREFGLWGYADRPTRSDVIDDRRSSLPSLCRQRSPRSGALSARGGAKGQVAQVKTRRASSAALAAEVIRREDLASQIRIERSATLFVEKLRVDVHDVLSLEEVSDWTSHRRATDC
jgi:hypothetical protein